MNIRIAAKKTRDAMRVLKARRSPDGLGISHAAWMLDEIEHGHIQGGKAHRWLGWAQAIVATSGVLSLEQLKEINADV